MKEAFEKIVERLEIYEYNNLIEHNEELCEHCKKTDCDSLMNCSVCIMDKAISIVNEIAEEYNGGWIPCSERLPEERDWYLAVFEEVDTGFIGLPYIAEYLMGKHTIFTTEDGWIIHNCTDREDVSSEYYKNLRCVAWQPLPEPFKERD